MRERDREREILSLSVLQNRLQIQKVANKNSRSAQGVVLFKKCGTFIFLSCSLFPSTIFYCSVSMITMKGSKFFRLCWKYCNMENNFSSLHVRFLTFNRPLRGFAKVHQSQLVNFRRKFFSQGDYSVQKSVFLSFS